jgi:hypothetical protein
MLSRCIILFFILIGIQVCKLFYLFFDINELANIRHHQGDHNIIIALNSKVNTTFIRYLHIHLLIQTYNYSVEH